MKKQMMLIALLAMLSASSLVMAKAGEKLEGTINVNTATASELMVLPGIGEAKAKLLIETRAAKPFASEADLLNVKGIGEKTLAQWQGHIRFDGPTTLHTVSVEEAASPAASASNSKAK